MSIDLEKNRLKILEVHTDVLDEKSDTDWALFGYEGQSHTLKVVSSGDDGLEGLSEDLNASKIMYAVVRVNDPKTTRPKIVLINWQGEGAPNLRKGMCVRHLPDVKRLLKGVHITVSARTEDEVESGVILNSVRKASATEYNFQDRSEMPEKAAPVGTNYRRTNPLSELNSNSRNRFWEEQEAEEKTRKDEEIKKREEEAKLLEKQRREREEKETRYREQLNRERNARISSEKKAEMAADQRTSEKASRNQQQHYSDTDHHTDELERIRRADHMRQERKKEAEYLIGHKTHQTRSIFEGQSGTRDYNSSTNSRSKPPPRVLKDFSPSLSQVEGPSNDISSSSSPILSSTSPKVDESAPKRVGMRWPPPSAEDSSPPPPQRNAAPGRIAEWKPIEEPSKIIPQETKPYRLETPIEDNHIIQHSTPVKDKKDWCEKTPLRKSNETSSERPPIAPSSAMAPPPNGHQKYDNGIDETKDLESYYGPKDPPQGAVNDDFSMTYEVEGVEYQILPEHGLCARAMYDYQAADDTEITFDPGDIITSIDQIDVGWWQGVSPAGVYGLFPANYVELINGARIH